MNKKIFTVIIAIVCMTLFFGCSSSKKDAVIPVDPRLALVTAGTWLGTSLVFTDPSGTTFNVPEVYPDDEILSCHEVKFNADGTDTYYSPSYGSLSGTWSLKGSVFAFGPNPDPIFIQSGTLTNVTTTKLVYTYHYTYLLYTINGEDHKFASGVDVQQTFVHTN